MPARSRPGQPALAVVLVAALTLVLGGCGVQAGRPAGPGALPPAPGPAPTPPAGVVDNAEHPSPPWATLPLRGAWRGGVGVGRASGAGSFDAPGVPPVAPGFEVGELPERVTVPGPASRPVRLEIPAIGVATRLVRLGLDPEGAMQVPGDFDTAGWFAGGPTPGQAGPAVIAGHVDSRTGPAVFHRLRELRPGQTILVERADGARLRFVVEQARSYPKAAFPTGDVFGPVPVAALRLITCTGDFDRARGSYRDNLVVFARLAGDGGNQG